MLQRVRLLVLIGFVLVISSACIGTAVSQTTDAAIAVAKIPFKVGGAVVDVATGGDEDDDK